MHKGSHTQTTVPHARPLPDLRGSGVPTFILQRGVTALIVVNGEHVVWCAQQFSLNNEDKPQYSDQCSGNGYIAKRTEVTPTG